MAENQMSSASPVVSESEFREEGIFWRSYDATIELLNERTRPVLVFVIDYDGTRWPFLREILRAMPKNEKLRGLLDGQCAPMLLEAGSIPAYMDSLGAGKDYHIAVLSPSGLTSMVSFSYVTSEPDTLVEEIAKTVEAIASHWD